MKKIINIIGLACLTLFVSCDKETEGISFETNYATFELTGDNPFNLPLGTAYVEPGVKAMAGTEELPVTASNDIKKDVLGIYTVNYSATNADGFEANTTRTVAVYNPTAPSTDISGTYTCDVTRTEADGSAPRPKPGLSVTISKVGPGIFYVTDLLGGYYSIASGYGSAYAMTGYLSLNADNSLTLLSSYVSGWGDGLAGFMNGTYDSATGEIKWTGVYAGNDYFNSILKK